MIWPKDSLVPNVIFELRPDEPIRIGDKAMYSNYIYNSKITFGTMESSGQSTVESKTFLTCIFLDAKRLIKS